MRVDLSPYSTTSLETRIKGCTEGPARFFLIFSTWHPGLWLILQFTVSVRRSLSLLLVLSLYFCLDLFDVFTIFFPPCLLSSQSSPALFWSRFIRSVKIWQRGPVPRLVLLWQLAVTFESVQLLHQPLSRFLKGMTANFLLLWQFNLYLHCKK